MCLGGVGALRCKVRHSLSLRVYFLALVVYFHPLISLDVNVCRVMVLANP